MKHVPFCPYAYALARALARMRASSSWSPPGCSLLSSTSSFALELLFSLFFFRVFLCKNRAKKGHTFAALCVSPCARPSARWRRRRPSSHPRGLFRRRCRLDSRGAGWKMERHRFCADVNVRDLRRQSRVRRRRHRVVVRGGRRSRRRKKARKRRDNERATREKTRRRTRAKAVAGRGP